MTEVPLNLLSCTSLRYTSKVESLNFLKSSVMVLSSKRLKTNLSKVTKVRTNID